MNNSQKIEKNENAVKGFFGALLFSLAGGLVWFLLYQVGVLAGLSGFVGVFCAIKGYEIFGGKLSKKGIVIAVVCAIVVLIIAWYLCLSLDVYKAYREWYKSGDVDYTVTFGQSITIAYLFLGDSSIAGPYFIDLGLGLLFAALGAVSVVRMSNSKLKLKEMQKETPAAYADVNAGDLCRTLTVIRPKKFVAIAAEVSIHLNGVQIGYVKNNDKIEMPINANPGTLVLVCGNGKMGKPVEIPAGEEPLTFEARVSGGLFKDACFELVRIN